MTLSRNHQVLYARIRSSGGGGGCTDDAPEVQLKSFPGSQKFRPLDLQTVNCVCAILFAHLLALGMLHGLILFQAVQPSGIYMYPQSLPASFGFTKDEKPQQNVLSLQSLEITFRISLLEVRLRLEEKGSLRFRLSGNKPLRGTVVISALRCLYSYCKVSN